MCGVWRESWCDRMRAACSIRCWNLLVWFRNFFLLSFVERWCTARTFSMPEISTQRKTESLKSVRVYALRECVQRQQASIIGTDASKNDVCIFMCWPASWLESIKWNRAHAGEKYESQNKNTPTKVWRWRRRHRSERNAERKQIHEASFWLRTSHKCITTLFTTHFPHIHLSLFDQFGRAAHTPSDRLFRSRALATHRYPHNYARTRTCHFCLIHWLALDVECVRFRSHYRATWTRRLHMHWMCASETATQTVAVVNLNASFDL